MEHIWQYFWLILKARSLCWQQEGAGGGQELPALDTGREADGR